MADGTEMTGDGNAEVGTGYAPPDQGLGDDAVSEIPVGVDQIEHEEPSGDADGAPEGGTATIDVSAIAEADGTARDATDTDTDAGVAGDGAEARIAAEVAAGD